MGEAPAFQFYARDFIVGTIAMTTAQVGLYIRALAHQWDSGPLCADEVELARTLTSPIAEFRKLWPVVSKKFDLTDSGYINARLEIERKKQQDYRAKKVLAGSKGGSKKKAEVPVCLPETESKVEANTSSAFALCDLQSATAVKAKTPRARRADSMPSEGFEEFWSAYPLKVAKEDAIKAWNQLAPSEALREFIGAALIWQRPSLTFEKDGQIKGKYPAAWLRGKRWEDERPAQVRPHGLPAPQPEYRDDWQDECREMHGGTCPDKGKHYYRARMSA